MFRVDVLIFHRKRWLLDCCSQWCILWCFAKFLLIYNIFTVVFNSQKKISLWMHSCNKIYFWIKYERKYMKKYTRWITSILWYKNVDFYIVKIWAGWIYGELHQGMIFCGVCFRTILTSILLFSYWISVIQYFHIKFEQI